MLQKINRTGIFYIIGYKLTHIKIFQNLISSLQLINMGSLGFWLFCIL